MTVGDLVAAYAYLALSFAPMRAMATVVVQWGQISAAVARLSELAQAPAPKRVERKIGHDRPWRVEVSQLAFRYGSDDHQEDDWLLRECSFSIARGSTVAILAPSGAGKTTLARILVGLLAPARGEIRIEGTPMNDLDPVTRARGISYVDQQAARCLVAACGRIFCSGWRRGQLQPMKHR